MENEFVKEKSNKGLIVAVVILSLIVVGLGGYLIYDNFFKDDDVNSNVKKIVFNNNEKEVPLYYYYDLYDNLFLPFYEIEREDDIYHKNSKLLVNDIDYDDKLLLASMQLASKTGDTYSAYSLESTYHKMFGDNAEFKIVNDFGNCPGSTYNSETKMYEFNFECGDTGMRNIYNVPVKATTDGDNLYIYEKSVFVSYKEKLNEDNSGEIVDLYKDYDMKEKIASNVVILYKDLYTFDFSEYYDKLNTYKYTFKSRDALYDNDYYFYGVEVVE